ncbi:TPA: hypothetical protein JG851_004987 [Vibrio parahaemolyticus]|nr:hypothetical protein [Vibrio parahaemolyticus]HBB9976949.1 hypothetical protein [Vibrio parahaemolyticus]HBC0013508.1 hypothetical protein [Vibrio parahaemolyticus]
MTENTVVSLKTPQDPLTERYVNSHCHYGSSDQLAFRYYKCRHCDGRWLGSWG